MKDIQFNTINLDQYNEDLEICALKLRLLSSSFTIICIYRSPTGNFTYFLHQLESILNKLYKTSTELIVCGDFNINYFNDNSRKLLLDSLLASFSLFSTVKFPTRIFNNSCTLIDNIYINTYRHDFSVNPLINGLSDHDAQIITLSNIFISIPRHVFSYTKKIDSNSISNFTFLLSFENLEEVFLEENVNIIFNNFLNIYLRIFYASFLITKSQNSYKSKPWLTNGIRNSCANKMKLYLTYRNSNDPNHKEYYKKNCQILTTVVMSAKKNSIIISFYWNLIIKQKQRLLGT